MTYPEKETNHKLFMAGMILLISSITIIVFKGTVGTTIIIPLSLGLLLIVFSVLEIPQCNQI